MKKGNKLILLFSMALIMTACAGPRSASEELECAKGLETAFAELEVAESKGFAGTVSLTKATGLLTAAKVQQQFEKYPNCIEKVKRARYYIGRAGK